MSGASSHDTARADLPAWVLRFASDGAGAASVLQLTRDYLAAPDIERNLFQQLWRPGDFGGWPDPFRLACTREGPGSCRERIRAALLGRGLSYPHDRDRRDGTLALAVVYTGCLLANCNPEPEFELIAGKVAPVSGDYLREFVRGERGQPTMQRFKLIAVEDETCGGKRIAIAKPHQSV